MMFMYVNIIIVGVVSRMINILSFVADTKITDGSTHDYKNEKNM